MCLMCAWNGWYQKSFCGHDTSSCTPGQMWTKLKLHHSTTFMKLVEIIWKLGCSQAILTVKNWKCHDGSQEVWVTTNCKNIWVTTNCRISGVLLIKEVKVIAQFDSHPSYMIWTSNIGRHTNLDCNCRPRKNSFYQCLWPLAFGL